jgi:positive regulator of sigma E activity
MAKKLKRVRRNPIVLTVELLMPWIVMAVVAVIFTSIGVERGSSIALALAGGLGTTFLIFLFERRRLGKKARRRQLPLHR